eukprot:gnl/Spiro4/5240_TR2646_c0_g1_i1.p1 gnl/Spiro4/5240_TR2646_c0_g1~~gnl/Spiro4/5240_TR2646_c0_g1_i1.p1  ORF type:complete len:380 (-),score=114.08 gnl/Spiro4/5240_TR2646_c0_g1_i1:14-1153(-)
MATAEQNGTSSKDFLCKMKFRNNLPDIPFDPKLLQYPFDPNRFVRYTPTTLEQNYQHALLTEEDLGIHFDLTDRDAYRPPPPGTTLEEADERLLQGTTAAASLFAAPRVKPIPRPVATWLRKTSYITSNEMPNVKTAVGHETAEGGRRYGRLARVPVTSTKSSRDKLVEAIENSFTMARQPVPPHPTNPQLTPVRVLPLFPDFDLWSNMYTQVNFDSAPIPAENEQDDDMVYESIIRGYKNNLNVCSLLYSKKRRREWEDEPASLQYAHVRDYVFTMKSLSVTDGGSYFLRIDEQKQQVVFNHLGSKINLTKKARTDISDEMTMRRGSTVEIHLRPADAAERENIAKRQADLLKPKTSKRDVEDEFVNPDSDSDEYEYE